MRRFLVIPVLAVVVAGCDSASDVTLLEDATTTTIPVSCDLDGLVGTPFPGGSGFPAVSIGYSNGLWLALGGNSPSGGRQLWASNDGAIWEPREYPDLGLQRPLWLGVSPSGVWLMATGDPRSIGSSQWWYSHDGEVWEVMDPTSELSGIESIVSVGDDLVSVSNLFATSEDGPYMRRVNHSSDGGRSWSEVPLDGEPLAVSAIGGEINVWGSREREPTRWRLSTGWRSESVDGLGSATAVWSVVEAPDGSFILVGGSPNGSLRTWFTSADLESWGEAVFPSDLPRDIGLSRIGPFLLAERHSESWVSLDGWDWTEIGAANLFELNADNVKFASDGAKLVGVSMEGMVSDHAMVFSGPNFPGGWDELTQLSWLQSLFGSGGERYFVDQGQVFSIAEGSVVPLPDAPAVFPDVAQIDVTESALFVRSSGKTWLFRDGVWMATDLPLSDYSVRSEGNYGTLVVERDGVFVTVTIEDGWVRKYVSEDGLRWIPSQAEPLEARAVYFDSDGWMRANPVTGDEDEFENWVDMFSVDGLEWTTLEFPWLYERVESDDESVTVHLPGQDVEFELPTDTTYLSAVKGSEEQIALVVEKDGEPYLLVLTSEGDEIWARRDMYDPFLTDVWYDGAFLYGTNTQPVSGQVIYVWNPDAE